MTILLKDQWFSPGIAVSFIQLAATAEISIIQFILVRWIKTILSSKTEKKYEQLDAKIRKNNFLAITCELFLCDVKVVAKKGGNGG